MSVIGRRPSFGKYCWAKAKEKIATRSKVFLIVKAANINYKLYLIQLYISYDPDNYQNIKKNLLFMTSALL